MAAVKAFVLMMSMGMRWFVEVVLQWRLGFERRNLFVRYVYSMSDMNVLLSCSVMIELLSSSQ